MEFIKTNSSYVKQTKHSLTKDGTIFERDITTLGGVNFFSATQVPVYTSGNFIITIDGSKPTKRKIPKLSWETNGDSEVWTLENIEGQNTTQVTDNNSSSEIVLKKDFYRLQDFAYYGSLYELVKASLNHIILTFPGEIYVPYTFNESNIKIGYSTRFTAQTLTSTVDYTLGDYILSGDEYEFNNEGFNCAISNPFEINFHIKNISGDTNDMSHYFFYEDNWKDYILITANNDEYDCAELIIDSVPSSAATLMQEGNEEYEYKLCVGEEICKVTFKQDDELLFVFKGYLGNNDKIYYLTNSDYLGVHVRPKKEKYDEFINNLNIFENYLLSKKESTVTNNIYYISTFEVIRENEQGYTKEIEDFLIPLDSSGYNIDVLSSTYADYAGELASLALYYDERFTDNLYRNMTHDSVKNFDWSYKRIYNHGDGEEYSEGNTRISNILHLFAREFDEVKIYTDSIKYVNTVTYNERNNLPDYFLSDAAEQKGWDLVSICPFTLTEYYLDDDNVKQQIINPDTKEYLVDEDLINESKNIITLDGKEKKIYRLFSQLTDKDYSSENYENIEPYRVNSCIPAGTFVYCDCDGVVDEIANTSLEKTIMHTDCMSFYRTMPFYSKENYGINDVNNEFLRRLILNTPHIFTHKGTIDGIEDILAMFGMKSKRWIDSLTNVQKATMCNGDTIFKESYYTPDYEIKEYTTFSNGFFDAYNQNKEQTWVNWFNTTKFLNYDYNGAYEGLPVIYESIYDYSGVTITEEEYSYLSESEQEKCTFLGNYVYPHFHDDIDGNPYYQMFGGWLAKSEFTFDKDNNIVLEGDEEKEDVRERTLFTETHTRIRAIDDISQISELAEDDMSDGDILYVEEFKNEYVVVNGYDFYKIEQEKIKPFGSDEYKEFNFIRYTVTPNATSMGDITFYNLFTFYNPIYSDGYQNISLSDIQNPIDVKIYLQKDEDTGQLIIQVSDTDGFFLPRRNFMLFLKTESGYKFVSYPDINMEEEFVDTTSAYTYTQYFVLHNKENCNFIDFDYGWEQLSNIDTRYFKINTIVEKHTGNNPHIGHGQYDMGSEYVEYFNYLFKHVLENDLINEMCFDKDAPEYYKNLMSEIGFNQLMSINTDEISSSDTSANIEFKYLETEDLKIHTFCDLLLNDKNSSNVEESPSNRFFREVTGNLCDTLTKKSFMNDYHLYNVNRITNDIVTNVSTYGVDDNEEKIPIIEPLYENDSLILSGITTNDEFSQIINLKRIDIIFQLHVIEENMYSIEALEERKYIENVILPYLEQMMPSNIICKIRYKYLESEYTYSITDVQFDDPKWNDTEIKIHYNQVKTDFNGNETSTAVTKTFALNQNTSLNGNSQYYKFTLKYVNAKEVVDVEQKAGTVSYKVFPKTYHGDSQPLDAYHFIKFSGETYIDDTLYKLEEEGFSLFLGTEEIKSDKKVTTSHTWNNVTLKCTVVKHPYSFYYKYNPEIITGECKQGQTFYEVTVKRSLYSSEDDSHKSDVLLDAKIGIPKKVDTYEGEYPLQGGIIPYEIERTDEEESEP